MLPPVVVGVQPVLDTVSSMIDVSESQLRDHLTTALSVKRWVDEVASGAPYADVAELVAVAERAGAELTGDEIDEALAHHPASARRRSERAPHRTSAAASSRRRS